MGDKSYGTPRTKICSKSTGLIIKQISFLLLLKQTNVLSLKITIVGPRLRFYFAEMEGDSVAPLSRLRTAAHRKRPTGAHTASSPSLQLPG